MKILPTVVRKGWKLVGWGQCSRSRWVFWKVFSVLLGYCFTRLTFSWAGIFYWVPIPHCVTSTSVVLLPKKDVPVTFADFRPISLCNFLNKVFTRILCLRIKPLLSKIIWDEQTVFVPGRDIVDNVLLAQELIKHLDRKAQRHNILFKLDMMKAFDLVLWDFLRCLLIKFGFASRFVNLILNNLQASWFSIIGKLAYKRPRIWLGQLLNMLWFKEHRWETSMLSSLRIIHRRSINRRHRLHGYSESSNRGL